MLVSALLPLALLLLGVSWATLGPLSIASFSAGWLLLLASPPLLYWRARRTGRLAGRRANLTLALVVSMASLQLVLSLAVGLRGSFHRAESHSDENVAFHPVLGHAPVLLPEHEEKGIVLDGTIGQRLRTVDPTRPQIVIMGDSVLHGWRLKEDQIVDAFLAPRFPDYQVLNISVSGYSIAQYYLYLKEHLQRTRPTVLVVSIYAGNDYESSGMSHWSGHSTPLFVPDGESIRLYRPEIPRVNCVDILSGSLLFKPLWRWFDFAMGLLEVTCNVRTLDEEEHAEVVHRLLQAIEKLAHDQGARLLYVLLPDANDFDRDSWYVKEKSCLPQLRAALERGGYRWVDFFAPLEAAGPTAKSFFLDDDSAHLNEAGMRLLADTLEGPIRALLQQSTSD